MAHAQTIYEVTKSKVQFNSQAPKELISATSTKLSGIVDITRKVFAFRILMSTFEGFNNPLQREHFNENYMETGQLPIASYTGKIIEDVDLYKDGSYEVRAKGKLTVHGVEQERIIKCHLERNGGKITITSDFVVLLADHNIKIPRIVYDKLAPEIKVSIYASLQQKP